MIRIGPQQRIDEQLQPWFERRQFQREAIHRRILAGDLDVLRHQLLARDLLPVADQLVHRDAEALSPIGLLVAFVGKGLAHDFAARGFIQLAIEGGETRHQVALGEHQIHRQTHFEQGMGFLNAFAQALGDTLLIFQRGLQDVVDADGDDQAIEWTALAMLAQQLKEGPPFAGLFLVVHVAAGGVQQDCFGAEKPVAVARATQARDPHAFALGVGEIEARLVEHGALARRRLPDHQVPGQGVQRILGVAASGLVAVQAFDALQQPLTQQADLFAIRRARVQHRLIGIVAQQPFEVVMA
ncbi:hypothetical protein D3C87_1188890 [compost metagenome]